LQKTNSEKLLRVGDKQMLARFLKARRQELGYSQRVLAERAQITQKTVSRIETGKDNTSLESLFPLMQALNLQLFLGMEEKSKAKEPA